MIPPVAKSSETLDGLDDEQRAAVTAPAGPVCILAGAGTGKTRAITRRIAHRVRTGEVRAQHVLAVTFTARAAAEMRARLTALDAAGVQARTFHAAALRQLRYFAPRLFVGRALPELIDRKGRLVGQAATRAGVSTDQAGARDLAAEIEWAKACLVEPSEYEVAAAKARREPPFAPATVAKVFDGYERIKRAAGVIDFEDLLRAAAWGIEEHSDVAEQVRAQYRHFVVDEYQDVNPVQHLVSFPRRYRGATVVRLVRDYRSTPQVVGLANAVISQARGDLARLRLALHGQRPSGPEPELRAFPDEPAEAASVARRCAELIAAGTPAREIAVLFRINAQSEVYEAALTEAGVPYVVHGAERFFERQEIRQAVVALRAATRTVEPGTPLHDCVVGALDAIGWRPDRAPAGGASRERWEALAALAALGDEFAQERQDLPEGLPLLEAFNAELARRAATQHAPAVDGVTLSSLHSAKGLEWDAVFLVGLAEGTLPIRHARTADAIEEERRLVYVGITRAREWLWLSYAVAQIPGGRQRRACRFVPALDPDRPPPGPRTPGRTRKEADGTRRRILVSCRICGTALISGPDRKLGRCGACPSDLDEELHGRLQEWRVRVAARQKVPPYVVFTDVTLAAIAERRPARSEDLVSISGIGPRKLGMYGSDVLRLIDGVPVDDLEDPSEEGLEK
jgi:DNA helicase-2/ATP-dependent DNA helicase PcrA